MNEDAVGWLVLGEGVVSRVQRLVNKVDCRFEMFFDALLCNIVHWDYQIGELIGVLRFDPLAHCDDMRDLVSLKVLQVLSFPHITHI